MKIRTEHYEHIKAACDEVVRTHPKARAEYKDAGYSALRYRWDIARAAGLIPYFCGVLYEYADDSHITTALNKAIDY